MKPKTLLNLNSEPVNQAPNIQSYVSEIGTESTFITVPEIMNILQISKPTFLKWLNTGRFQGVRMLERNKGDSYRFLKADFEKWLSENVRA